MFIEMSYIIMTTSESLNGHPIIKESRDSQLTLAACVNIAFDVDKLSHRDEILYTQRSIDICVWHGIGMSCSIILRQS